MLKSLVEIIFDHFKTIVDFSDTFKVDTQQIIERKIKLIHRAKNNNDNHKIIRRDPHWEGYWTMVYTSNKDEENLEEYNDSNDVYYEDDYK